KVTSKPVSKKRPIPVAKRVRLAFEELGPTFVKMGQILSTRPDLIPQEFIEEFTRLQSSVPPIKYSEAKQVIQEELGVKRGKLRTEINHELSAATQSYFNRLTDRLVSAIVIAVLLVGSSIMVLSDIPPKWNSIPVIGLLGFLSAAVMGVFAILTIWKKCDR
ncbi:hypothetical protein ACFL6U_00660, partial [Planctomycetota bacterium]